MDEESKEFLLEEYKAAWEMVRYLSQQRDKWMKYYFTIVAAVFLYISGALKLSYDKVLERDCRLYGESFFNVFEKIIQNSPVISASIIFLLILLFIIGIAVFITTLYWRKQSTEYYNALNEIRRLFKERDYDIYYYITLRTATKKAFAKEGVDFYTSIIIGLINSIILILILVTIFYPLSPSIPIIFSVSILIIAATCFYLHLHFYKKILTKLSN